jgi:hypothetical protein
MRFLPTGHTQRMRRPSPLPTELAGTPFTVAEAAAAGVGRQRLRASDLHAPFHGVRSSSPLATPLDLARAYAARMPEQQFFSHVTAAQLWDFPMPRALERRMQLDVSVVAPSHPPQMQGVSSHRLSSGRWVVERGGLRVVTPAIAWAQLAGTLSVTDLIVAGDHLVRRKRPHSTMEQLRAVASRQILREALRSIRPCTDSPQETRLRLLLVAGGLPEPVVGYTVTTDAGFVATPDLAYVDVKVAIEYLGSDHWTNPRVFADDIQRRELLQAAGWRVIEVIAADLTHASAALLARVVRATAAGTIDG